MRPRAIVQVTIFNDETGVVEQSIVQEVSGGGAYHWRKEKEASQSEAVEPSFDEWWNGLQHRRLGLSVKNAARLAWAEKPVVSDFNEARDTGTSAASPSAPEGKE